MYVLPIFQSSVIGLPSNNGFKHLLKLSWFLPLSRTKQRLASQELIHINVNSIEINIIYKIITSFTLMSQLFQVYFACCELHLNPRSPTAPQHSFLWRNVYVPGMLNQMSLPGNAEERKYRFHNPKTYVFKKNRAPGKCCEQWCQWCRANQSWDFKFLGCFWERNLAPASVVSYNEWNHSWISLTFTAF